MHFKLTGDKDQFGNSSILSRLSQAILKYALYENEMQNILKR